MGEKTKQKSAMAALTSGESEWEKRMENDKMLSEKSHKAYAAFEEEYPILYGGGATPYGCPPGWRNILDKLSSRLELVNLTDGRQFGFEIVASQVKEKFGTLRFYYEVRGKAPLWRRILSYPFIALFSTRGLNENTCYFHGPISKFASAMSGIGFAIRGGGNPATLRMVDEMVDSLVDEAEEETFRVCADCGKNLSPAKNRASPRCETTGWINFVCEDCAKKRGTTYLYYLSPEDRAVVNAMDPKTDDPEELSFLNAISRTGKIMKDGEEIPPPETAKSPKRRGRQRKSGTATGE